jgi:hypothetical protein
MSDGVLKKHVTPSGNGSGGGGGGGIKKSGNSKKSLIK